MTSTSIFLGILCLAHVILVIVMIPVLMQILKTAKQVEATLTRHDTILTPLLLTVSETVEELQLLTSSINNKVEKTDTLFAEIGEASHVVAATTSIIKDSIGPVLIQLAGVTSGIKAFTTFFRR